MNEKLINYHLNKLSSLEEDIGWLKNEAISPRNDGYSAEYYITEIKNIQQRLTELLKMCDIEIGK